MQKKSVIIAFTPEEAAKKPDGMTWRRVLKIGFEAVARYSKARINAIILRDTKERYTKKK